MNSKDRDEAVKWMRLGYETHGLAGLSAVAAAMGMKFQPASSPHGTGTANTTVDAPKDLSATQGGDTLEAEESASPDYRFRYGPIPRSRRRPLACPPTPPQNNPDWRPYVGAPEVFHCGFDGSLENRKPSPHWSIGECFYDESGQLVDDAHPYAGCKGTPDQYDAEDGLRHFFLDEGGPVRSGGPALWESLWYSPNDRVRWEGRFKQYRRPR